MDRAERLAFNALPAALTDETWGNVYVQQANSVLVGRAKASLHTASDSPSAAGADEGLGSAAAAWDIRRRWRQRRHHGTAAAAAAAAVGVPGEWSGVTMGVGPGRYCSPRHPTAHSQGTSGHAREEEAAEQLTPRMSTQ